MSNADTDTGPGSSSRQENVELHTNSSSKLDLMGDTGPGSSSRQEEKLNTLADVLSEDSTSSSSIISSTKDLVANTLGEVFLEKEISSKLGEASKIMETVINRVGEAGTCGKYTTILADKDDAILSPTNVGKYPSKQWIIRKLAILTDNSQEQGYIPKDDQNDPQADVLAEDIPVPIPPEIGVDDILSLDGLMTFLMRFRNKQK